VEAQPYPEGGAVTQISIHGGSPGVWSRGGREIFFPGRRRLPVERGRFIRRFGHASRFAPTYDVAPDGRFLMAVREGRSVTGDLVLVRNWVQEVTGRR